MWERITHTIKTITSNNILYINYVLWGFKTGVDFIVDVQTFQVLIFKWVKTIPAPNKYRNKKKMPNKNRLASAHACIMLYSIWRLRVGFYSEVHSRYCINFQELLYCLDWAIRRHQLINLELIYFKSELSSF